MADEGAPSGMRKHEIVRERVLDLLEGLSSGSAIPPERELCERFDVSRVTLRRAVDDLVRDGVLSRRQGSGTYVAQPKLAQALSVRSFSQDMRQRGLEPSSQVLSVERVPAGPRLGQRLAVSPADPVVRIRRLRLADGEPLGLETASVPAALAPGLEEADLEGSSLYEVLARDHGIAIASGSQEIEPTVINEEESLVLDAPLHSPAFLFRLTTRAGDGTIIEFNRSIFRGDRLTLTTELEPRASEASGLGALGVSAAGRAAG